MHRALWEVHRHPERAAEFAADPDGYLAGFDLTDEQRRALRERDLRAIFLLRAHPFLLYSFALRLGGGFSLELTARYLDRIGDLDLQDIET
jgi:hypothetical protein